MGCGYNEFGKLLGIKYKGIDIFPPKYNEDTEHFVLMDFMQLLNIPRSILMYFVDTIIGIRPPCSVEYPNISLGMIKHAFTLKPIYLMLYLPPHIKDELIVPIEYELCFYKSFDTEIYDDNDDEMAIPSFSDTDTLYIWRLKNKRNGNEIIYQNKKLRSSL